jgi:hypothetical protein
LHVAQLPAERHDLSLIRPTVARNARHGLRMRIEKISQGCVAAATALTGVMRGPIDLLNAKFIGSGQHSLMVCALGAGRSGRGTPSMPGTDGWRQVAP